MSTGIIILAAGESARMGEPKQLLVHGGKTLLQHAIDTALSIEESPVIVVLGAHAGEIQARLNDSGTLDPRVRLVENVQWPEGMGSSLRAGLRKLMAEQPGTSATLFLVCDQPLLTPETLGKLIASHQESGRPIVASAYKETLGVPALFDRALFPELLALQGAEGAKELIRRHRDQAVSLPFPDGAIDIDTPDDCKILNLCSTHLTTSIPT